MKRPARRRRRLPGLFRLRRGGLALTLWLGLLCGAAAQAAEGRRLPGPMREVLIFGNARVERQAILNLIDTPPGTYLDDRRLEQIEQRLLGSNLFKKVQVLRRANPDGSADLYLRLAEKHTLFLMPTAQAWSGRYSGGFVFGESNLFGGNKKTVLAVSGGNKASYAFGMYQDEALFDTNYLLRLDALWRRDYVPLYRGADKLGELRQSDSGVVLYPGYQWTPEIRTLLAVDYRHLWSGDSPVAAIVPSRGNDLAFRFEFLFDSLKRRSWRLEGYKLKAAFEFSDPRLGSDFQYNKESLEGEAAFLLWRWFYLYTSLQGKLGRNLPFHKEFTLGGESLRGYAEKQFRGDTCLRLRNELYYPLFDHRLFSLRGLIFFDSGVVYRDQNGINRDAFNNGLGGGLRIFLKEVVAPVMGLDAAYGLERQGGGVYFSLGLVQF